VAECSCQAEDVVSSSRHFHSGRSEVDAVHIDMAFELMAVLSTLVGQEECRRARNLAEGTDTTLRTVAMAAMLAGAESDMAVRSLAMKAWETTLSSETIACLVGNEKTYRTLQELVVHSSGWSCQLAGSGIAGAARMHIGWKGLSERNHRHIWEESHSEA
jgi:hypothetical protein